MHQQEISMLQTIKIPGKTQEKKFTLTWNLQTITVGTRQIFWEEVFPNEMPQRGESLKMGHCHQC